MIILDVPTVGGRLILVDMAGSENIEQAGQIGFEAKMQTAKINQGNIALKRVVESIANGDSHVPFRDSKLTMLLQDSFEDDKSKILMILCASPDPREIHKTISTLEYGAKAKCIVRGPHTPIKDKISTEDSSSIVILGSRIAAMDEFIFKLQRENELREKERNEVHKELLKKEEEVSALRARLGLIEGKGSSASDEEINLMVNERAKILKQELEKKLEECQKMANEFVELERRRMEEKILQQQQEVEMLRKRLEEIESELCHSRDESGEGNKSKIMDASGFAKRLLQIYKSQEDTGMMKSIDMVKSMDLDMDDQEPLAEVKLGGPPCKSGHNAIPDFSNQPHLNTFSGVVGQEIFAPNCGDKACLSTVYEEEEEEREDEHEEKEDEEVEKEIIEEKRVCTVDQPSPGISLNNIGSLATATQNIEVTPLPGRNRKRQEYYCKRSSDENKLDGYGLIDEQETAKDSASSRLLRIQNIFTLCGNHRELSQHIRTVDCKSPLKDSNKENMEPPYGLGLKDSNKENMEPPYGLSQPRFGYV
ncbi:Kinesin-like protein [Quillaja saponaria]|uniref:Kinesin-like protein n=1 Tax=Quillaja saponaria TaxID=32244 RepID=A0AAD7QEA5_QUISA|nr:Kinesin-like protein [Quillaja saponaria]